MADYDKMLDDIVAAHRESIRPILDAVHQDGSDLSTTWPPLDSVPDDVVLLNYLYVAKVDFLGWDVLTGDPENPGAAAPGGRAGSSDPSGWLSYATFWAHRSFAQTLLDARKAGYGVKKESGRWKTYRLGPDEPRELTEPPYTLVSFNE